MALVDTTVWIDLLRGSETPAVSTLRRLLTEGQAVTALVIVQEILQGASSPASLKRLREQGVPARTDTRLRPVAPEPQAEQ